MIPPKFFLRCEKLYGNCCNLDENINKPPDFPETISSTVLANLASEQNQTMQRKQVARTDQSRRMIWDVTLFLTHLQVHYTPRPNKCYQIIFPLFTLIFRDIFKRDIMWMFSPFCNQKPHVLNQLNSDLWFKKISHFQSWTHQTGSTEPEKWNLWGTRWKNFLKVSAGRTDQS